MSTTTTQSGSSIFGKLVPVIVLVLLGVAVWKFVGTGETPNINDPEISEPSETPPLDLTPPETTIGTLSTPADASPDEEPPETALPSTAPLAPEPDDAFRLSE